jgi:hypothetical protein
LRGARLLVEDPVFAGMTVVVGKKETRFSPGFFKIQVVYTAGRWSRSRLPPG